MRSKTYVLRFLPLAFFLIASLPHHPFSYWLDDVLIVPVGFESVQHMADIASWALLGVAAFLFARVAFVHRWRALKHICIFLLLLALMYGTDYSLVVNNIERVHYPQYALLALLLGLSLRNEMLIFFVTTFFGFMDEFLQFAMDPMKTNYLDFNDIVLNILGAAAGVVLLMGLRRPLPGSYDRESDRQESEKMNARLGSTHFKNSWRSWRPWRFPFQSGSRELSRYESVFERSFRLSMAVGALVILVAGLFGRFEMLVEQAKDRSVLAVVNGKLAFIMSFEGHDDYWIKSDFGKIFHVLSVGEGLLIITLLCLGTWGAIWWLGRRRT